MIQIGTRFGTILEIQIDLNFSHKQLVLVEAPVSTGADFFITALAKACSIRK